ncbi:hypothetical protein BGX24_006253 [Mortierella sp. AD032]|nr:hypothetical protein BGX24_006253 [Mortierella sp. AD032]
MWEGIGAVTDPSTGLIYLAGGYDDISAKTKALKVLNTFDPVSMTIHRDDLPAPDRAFPERWYYGNVWSRNRSSVIYWGGNNRAPDQQLSPVENGVTELQPSSMGWYTFPMQGVPPTVRVYHCMAANEGGTKIVIYGGQLRNTTIVGELWILDLVQFTWTQGPSGPIRMYAACTIVDDQFLLWGGSIAQNMVAPAEMVIYNLTSSQYVTQYTPPSWYKDQGDYFTSVTGAGANDGYVDGFKSDDM